MRYPKRGEIFLVDFSPARGSEQRGARPALVVQNDIGNRVSSTVIVCALTTTLKEYPINVVVKPGESGLPETSAVNCSQILTIDKTRLTRRVGRVSQAAMARVDHALLVSLDLENP